MIASLRTEITQPQIDGSDAVFQAMLPIIRRQAGRALRQPAPKPATSWSPKSWPCAFSARGRLVAQGRPEIVRPTPLVRYCAGASPGGTPRWLPTKQPGSLVATNPPGA